METILIHDNHEVFVVRKDDIIYLQGDGRYTHVHVVDELAKGGMRKFLTCRNLKDFERELRGRCFQRVNKQMIIGIRFIYSVKNGTQITLRKVRDLFIDLSPVFRQSFWKKLRPASSRKK